MLHRLRYLTIDLDSLPVEVHGEQGRGSEYNGHYHCRIYHPLIASVAGTGDLLDDAVARRPPPTRLPAESTSLLPLLVDVERELCQVAAVRIDAGFPEENILSALEARRTPYVARVKNNAVLNRMAEPFLKRPVGRPPKEPRTWFYEQNYQAGPWSHPRRVVLVTLERPGQLFLDHFWLITNWSPEQMDGPALLEMYRERGTAEGHMGELMDVLRPALSSSARPKSHYQRQEAGALPARSIDAFARNEVILLLNALAYNIAHAGRVLMGDGHRRGWKHLRRCPERVLRVAARGVVVHGRRAITSSSARTLPNSGARSGRGSTCSGPSPPHRAVPTTPTLRRLRAPGPRGTAEVRSRATSRLRPSASHPQTIRNDLVCAAPALLQEALRVLLSRTYNPLLIHVGTPAHIGRPGL